MSASRSSIFLGDVAAAICKLAPAGEDAARTRHLIAQLLGFRRTEAPTTVREQEPSERTLPDQVQPEKTSASETENGNGDLPPEPEKTAAPAATRWLPSSLTSEAVPRKHADVAMLFSGIEPLPLPPQERLDSSELPLGEPLFQQAWSRALFAAILATSRDGEMDLDALIEKVARLEHLEHLPAEPLPTLRRGAQVLIDTGAGMQPFSSDKAWALGEIQRVVGRELVEVQSFSRVPGQVSAGIFKKPRPYVPPLSGTPVLLLTDLSIGRPPVAADRADVQEWAAFAARVRSAGCPLVALLPYSPARWPKSLRRLIVMIHWDPRISIGRLRATMGRAHHVR